MCSRRIDREHRVVKLLQHFASEQCPLLFASSFALVQLIDSAKCLGQLHGHSAHLEQGGRRKWHAANILATVVRKSREHYCMLDTWFAFTIKHDPAGELVEPRDV